MTRLPLLAIFYTLAGLDFVTAQTWTQLPPSGLAVMRHAMASDLGSGFVYSFGGQESGFVSQDDVWRFQNGAWVDLATPPGPMRRHSHALAVDPASGALVLFGGTSELFPFPRTSFDDTWLYDPNSNTWSRDNRPGGPGPRQGARMVADISRQKILLFGGLDAQTNVLHDDTWEYDVATGWSRIVTANAPSPRRRYAMAYDLARGRVVLFGGDQAGIHGTFPRELNDTWEFDGTDWSQAVTTAPPPLDLDSAAMAFSTARVTTILVAGFQDFTIANPLPPAMQTWEWDGTHWWRLEFSVTNFIPRSGFALADVGVDGVLAFGGNDSDTPGHAFPFIDDNDPWLFGGAMPELARRGFGCAGSQGDVSIDRATPFDLPGLGTTLGLQLDNALGISAIFVALSELDTPADLTPLGFPGCRYELGPGTALLSGPFATLSIPGNPLLRGLRFYAQGVSIDGAGGLATSDVLRGTVR